METQPLPPGFRLGTCAWSFEEWHGFFYPPGLPAAERLPYYARFFNSVEIDSTFYAAPAPQIARHWLEATPPDFRFSCKLPREITHQRRFRACHEILRNFLSNIAPLRAKLSAILIQLPPYVNPRKDGHALLEFLDLLPPDFHFAVEFRDPAWAVPRFIHALEERRVCWAWNDLTSPEHALEGPFEHLPHTADFLYVRLLGDNATKYGPDGERVHRYTRISWPRDPALDSWAVRVHQVAHNCREVLVYVNNHFEGFSPATCRRFAARFGQEIVIPTPESLLPPPPPSGNQLELFS